MAHLSKLHFRFAKLRLSWIVFVLVSAVVYLSHSSLPIASPTDLWPFASVQDISQEINLATWVTSPELVDFWHSLSEDLVESKPKCDKLIPDRKVYEDEIQFDNKTDIRPDLIHMSDKDFDEMQLVHDLFVSKLGRLKSKLPYRKGTQGIVTTAGGRYMGIFVTSLLMLRRSGSVLPVHVLISSPDDDPKNYCNGILRTLGATCLTLSEIWETSPVLADINPVSYQFKALSILLSPFEKVLFLDADCFPGHNPDHLLASEPLTQSGLVTWPDLWKQTASPLFYNIARVPAPSLAERRSSESSILMYDKTKHADTLILANYYNFWGPGYYYPLLSQGAAGEGDKETFLHAALVLDKPFYDVSTPLHVMGKWVNDTFATIGLRQADPADDWEKFGKLDKVWVESDGEEAKARPFFIHHNLGKLDITHLFSEDAKTLLRGGHGERIRLWGPKESLVNAWGYDIEKVLWEEMAEAGCRMASANDCISIKEYLKLVASEDADLPAWESTDGNIAEER